MSLKGARLAAIYVYPIKSCRGVASAEARVLAAGLEGDRRVMLFEPDSGRFISQREEPSLAQVTVRARADTLEIRADVSGPGASPTAASPTAVLRPPRQDGPRQRVQVWGDHTEALVHEEGSEFFTAFLGRPVNLGFLPAGAERRVDPRYASEHDVVGFADGFPLLATVRESLDELVRRAGTPLEMERFRPNVVIEGVAPFNEDDWDALQIGPARFRAPKPCDRCVITTLDPRTGKAGKEPLRTLATFRRQGNKTLFGINLIPESDSVGMTVRVGDPVVIQRRATALVME